MISWFAPKECLCTPWLLNNKDAGFADAHGEFDGGGASGPGLTSQDVLGGAFAQEVNLLGALVGGVDADVAAACVEAVIACCEDGHASAFGEGAKDGGSQARRSAPEEAATEASPAEPEEAESNN